MPILVDHSYTLWSLAWDARNRAMQAGPSMFASDATVAIIIAAAAAEGFINELADVVQAEEDVNRTLAERGESARYFVLPGLSAFARAHEELEKARRSTTDKYLAASECLGQRFDRGGQPYQDFATLMRLRDVHMHLRNRDRDGPIEHPSRGEPTMTFLPPEGRIAFIRSLQQRGLTWKADDAQLGASWLTLLQTKEMAEWACGAALAIILAVLDMIPDRLGDTALMFKQDFRRHASAESSPED